MGEAFICGLLESDLLKEWELWAAEVDADRRDYLQKRYPVTIVSSAVDATIDASVILIAVKPEGVEPYLDAAAAHLNTDSLVISIAAGIPIRVLARNLPPAQPLVRAMPNLAATIGAGITAYVSRETLSPEQASTVEAILGAAGQVVCFEKEEDLDLVTAVSGSGPAYVFALAEAMELAATEFGMDRDVAYLLVSRTILGAARLLTEKGPGSPEGRTAAEWRAAVTSKGGTTEAALAQFNEAGLNELVKRAISAARIRSREIGGAAVSGHT